MTDHATIEEMAALWLIRKTDADWSKDCQQELDAWLGESYAHAAAFWRLEQGYAQLDYLASLPLIPPEYEPKRKIAQISRLLAVAATIVAVFCGAWLFSGEGINADRDKVTSYSTELGEISKIELFDGTEISLDSQSAIRVSDSPDKRKIWLDRGRAYFSVSRDPNRPFQVHAGLGEITVLGTNFLVSRQDESVSVSVLNGKVRFARSGSSKDALLLHEGSVGIIDSQSISAKTGDLRAMEDNIAWRDGMVMFMDTPIENAIEEFNKYNRKKLVIRNEETRLLRIDGSFRVGNIDGFARLLENAYGFKVDIIEEDHIN